MVTDYVTFFGVTQIGNYGLRENIETNLINFFDYAFLSVGAFISVDHPASGIFNNPFTTLRISEDKNYIKGQVWETFHGNWVWESGIPYTYQPTQISGVYVNNTFYPVGTSGANSFSLNYPLGRVIFDTPLAITSKVELNYSYRYVNVYSSESLWFKQFIFNANRTDSTMYMQLGSGIWSIFGQNRAYLPAVFIEMVPRRDLIGKQLGGGQFMRQDTVFHIFAETPVERNNIMDILYLQWEKKMYLYDKTVLQASGAFPLNIDGTLSAHPLCYPDLVNTYPWKSLYFYNVDAQEVTDYIPGMFKGIMRATLEIDY